MLIVESYGAPVKREASLDMGTILLGGVDEVVEKNFDPLENRRSTPPYYLQALTYKSPPWTYEKVKRRRTGWHQLGFTETPSYGITSYHQFGKSGGVVPRAVERADGEPIGVPGGGEPGGAQPGEAELIGRILRDNEQSSTTPVGSPQRSGGDPPATPGSLYGNVMGAGAGMLSTASSLTQTAVNKTSSSGGGLWSGVVNTGKGYINTATSSVLNQAKATAKELLKSLIPKNLRLYITLFIVFVITFICCCICCICMCFCKLLREIRKVPEKTQRRLEGKDCYDDTCR